MDKVHGRADYVDLFLSERMVGSRGYPKHLGLIRLPEADLEDQRQRWQARTGVSAFDLEDRHSGAENKAGRRATRGRLFVFLLRIMTASRAGWRPFAVL